MNTTPSMKRRRRRQKKQKHDAERRKAFEERSRQKRFSNLAEKPTRQKRKRIKLQDRKGFTNEEEK